MKRVSINDVWSNHFGLRIPLHDASSLTTLSTIFSCLHCLVWRIGADPLLECEPGRGWFSIGGDSSWLTVSAPHSQPPSLDVTLTSSFLFVRRQQEGFLLPSPCCWGSTSLYIRIWIAGFPTSNPADCAKYPGFFTPGDWTSCVSSCYQSERFL